MIISRLEYQKKDPNRISVFSNDSYEFSLSANLVLKYGLHLGKEVTDAEIEVIFQDDLVERLYSRCIDYIARSPRSIAEIRRYIGRTLYSKKENWDLDNLKYDESAIVEEIIERLKNLKLLDDTVYARKLVEYKLSRRAFSKMELKSELISKGIDREIIDLVISESLPDENASAVKALEKRFSKSSITSDDRKAIAYLQRKGYSWDVISGLINNDIRE